MLRNWQFIGSKRAEKPLVRVGSWLSIFFILFISISLLVSQNVSSVRADAPFQEEFRGTGHLGFVANGVGTRGDPYAGANGTWTGSGSFTLTVPSGATIRKARLIWTGKSDSFDADGVELAVDGTSLFNSPVLPDKQFIESNWAVPNISLRHETADITADLQALGLSGIHTFTVSDHEHATQAKTRDLNFGVGIWVVYEHPNEPVSEIVVYQGMDSFFFPRMSPQGPHSLVSCADFTADNVNDRVADVVHMVAGVDNYNQGSPDDTRARSNALWFEVGSGIKPPSVETYGGSGNPPTLSVRPNGIGVGGVENFPFQSYAGLEWDMFNMTGGVNVAAGDEWVCFQIESGDSANLTTNPPPNAFTASGMWNLYMLRVREESEEIVIPVDIDVWPFVNPNLIFSGQDHPIPVAILSTEDFDAVNEIDFSSLTFGQMGDEQSLDHCLNFAMDVNGDDIVDQTCIFRSNQTGLQVGDTEAILKGLTVEGSPIEGVDVVQVMQRKGSRFFRTFLRGRNEVPSVSTRARGSATIRLSKDETRLTYFVSTRRTKNVTAIHLHCGFAEVNGPVGVTLFSGGPDTKRFYRGTITAVDDGNACGWTDLESIVMAMRSGDTYINVHTEAHPSGEIRGQVRSVGP